MLTISRLFSLHIPFSQVPNAVSTCGGKCLFSRYRKLSRESDYNDCRDAAEFVETSLFGDNFEQSVSALKHEKLVERRKHKFSVLQKKYSDNPIELSVLTWRAKIQIISLLNGDEQFDFEELSNLFPITALGARKLFRSKSPSTFQKSVDIRWLLKHDSQVIERWNHLLLFLKRVLSGEDNVSESNLHSMIPFGLAWLFTNAKMNLLIHANGNPDLPHPEKCYEIIKKSNSFGRFEIYAEIN
ncbi:zinc finger protein [Schistosoma japonicum]|uniref:Zinc finger protein n=1 Tax=Schistosoma japonicum TaxID=6182 RepID=A0A4Z2DIB3_SCHJA|nr:zinc finger protein [Schistosoma japonicum]